nr:hypothetical protein [uncultured Pseudomonas sp.]
MSHQPTLGDIFNNLSFGQVWGLILAVVAVISGSLSAGYWFGQRVSDGQSAVEISSLQTRVQLLESSQESTMSSLVQWRDAYKALEVEMTSRNNQVSQLSSQLSQQNNCVFIQNQIGLNKQRMDAIDSTMIYASESAYGQRLREERQDLNQENARYQEQLGRCGR